MGVGDSKKFIILQEDDNGFSFNGKKPSGYTKIEEKDSQFKIFYYIQNVNDKNLYTLNLIINDDSGTHIFSIGEVKPNLNGKIDACYDFDESLLNNVCGSSISCKNLKGELKFPLSGFLPKRRIFNWKVSSKREFRTMNLKKEESLLKDVHEVLKEPTEVKEINDNTQEVLINQEEVIDICKEYEEKISKEAEECKEVYSEAREHILSLKKLLTKDNGEIERMLRSIIPDMGKKREEMERDYNYRFFFNVINDFDEVETLNFDGYSFFKVDIDNFSQMRDVKKVDEVKYGVVYYPMLSMYPYFREKGYFLVGINYDKEKGISNLVYGIEVDEGFESLFPYDGKTGFNRYVYDYETSKGYHIMEYDYKECKVI